MLILSSTSFVSLLLSKSHHYRDTTTVTLAFPVTATEEAHQAPQHLQALQVVQVPQLVPAPLRHHTDIVDGISVTTMTTTVNHTGMGSVMLTEVTLMVQTSIAILIHL